MGPALSLCMPDDNANPYRLELPADLQEKLDHALCDAVTDTVRACRDRDDELRGYRAILEGWSQPQTNQPWPGACDLQDTSPRELHNTVCAAVYSAARQYPYGCLEAVHKEDVDVSPDAEDWLNIEVQRYGWEDILYDGVYLSGEGRYAPIYVGLKQEVRRHFKLETPPPTVEGEEQPEPELQLEEDPQPPGLEFRAPNPWDFYFYPVQSRGPQVLDGCLLVAERMDLTREDLLLGVAEGRYDEVAVEKMLKSPGAKIDTDTPNDETMREGLDTGAITDRSEAEPWECFQVVGRAPQLKDAELPDALLHTDCCWMCCPALGIVFKQSYSSVPLGLRPYSLMHLVYRPNSPYGEGIISMLADNFEEQTTIIRFGVNVMNLEASPAQVVSESWLTRYSKWTLAPGRWLPRQPSDPVGPKPLVWDIRSNALISTWLDRLDMRAHRLAASESVNKALQHNVKAAQVHFEEAMQQSKFDFFLSNIHRGVKDALYLAFVTLLKAKEELQEPVVVNGKEIDLKPEDVSDRFRIIPQASTDAISPAQRLAKGMSVAQIVRASIRYQQQAQAALQTGQPSPMDDELTHRLLQLAGERNPERFVPHVDPQEQQAMPMMGMPMLPGGQNGAQPGVAPASSGVTGTVSQLAGIPGDEGAGMLQASPFSPNPNGNGAGY